MSEALTQCSWCSLSARNRGLVIGIVGSLVLHVCAFTLIRHAAAPKAPTVRVIDVGEFTIRVPQAKRAKVSEVEL